MTLKFPKLKLSPHQEQALVNKAKRRKRAGVPVDATPAHAIQPIPGTIALPVPTKKK